jgi:hypothetical protein
LTGRSSIPETAAIESRGRRVLDAPPSRGMTAAGYDCLGEPARKKSREPASVFAAAGSGWGSLLSWEETAVGRRLGLADEQPPTQSRFAARRL